jgi:hypothetical protein
MSVALGFGLNGKSLYSNVAKPCQVNLNWIVDASNGNGLGIRSLKSNGYVNNVFMHTSATPGSNNGVLNPNPAIGFALIQMKQNFNYFLGASGGFVTPTATSTKIDNSALVVGQPYVISVLGDATAAQWLAIGVPAGVTPAVGVPFIAKTVGAGANTSTSRVQLPTSSGIAAIEVVGDANTTSNSNIASNAGQFVLLQFSTGGVATAPAAGSVVGLSLLFDGSSVTIDGI